MTSGSHRRKWALWGGLVILFLLGCALLVPNDAFIPHKIAAHESSAVAQLRTIFQEQEKFRAGHNGGFAEALSQLPGVKSSDRSYNYSLEITAKDEQGRASKYVVTASPALLGKTGTLYFSIDETGALRLELMHAVTANSPILQ